MAINIPKVYLLSGRFDFCISKKVPQPFYIEVEISYELDSDRGLLLQMITQKANPTIINY